MIACAWPARNSLTPTVNSVSLANIKAQLLSDDAVVDNGRGTSNGDGTSRWRANNSSICRLRICISGVQLVCAADLDAIGGSSTDPMLALGHALLHHAKWHLVKTDLTAR